MRCRAGLRGRLSLQGGGAAADEGGAQQHYAVGIKEIIKLPAATIEDRFGLAPGEGAAIDFIDHALHVPVVSKAMKTAAGSVDATGTAFEGLTKLTQTLAGGVFDVFGINRTLVRSGYVQIIVDVRGTGASHGKWEILGAREQQDSVEILDWVREQEWCDGKLGLAGWSYSAINSLQGADKRPEGLGAVFAVEGCDDIVRDIYITGGMPSAFIPAWLSVSSRLKSASAFPTW